MPSKQSSVVAVVAMSASIALAKTDLTGCTTTDLSSPAGASVAWYVPGTGEICAPLDCGGGRAPPMTTVPGCPLYSGTATYSPSYLAGYTMMASAASSTSSGVDSWSSNSVDWPTITDTATSSWDLYTNAPSSWDSSSWSSTAWDSASWSSTASDSAWSSSAPTSSGFSTLSATTSTTAVYTAPGISNSTATVNGTVSGTRTAALTPSASPISATGAAGTAKAFAGSAGVLLGLGALIVAL